MRYKIIYHVGTELDIKTKVSSGTLIVEGDTIRISGSSPLTIPLRTVVSVEMFRLHGLGRMIKLVCTERTVFLTVVRFNLFGYFVLINFVKAGELYEALRQNPSPESPQKSKLVISAPWLALGLGVGTALGVVFHNIAVGVGLGTALGILCSTILSKRAGKVCNAPNDDTQPKK
jgi:hypothetical protein